MLAAILGSMPSCLSNHMQILSLFALEANMFKDKDVLSQKFLKKLVDIL
jgi:hypothetical protein